MAYTTINKSTDYFNTKLYSGNGSTNAITGVGFAPDFVWIKERTSTSSHVLGNTIQGTGKRLSSNTTDAEASLPNIFTSFDSDGFTHGADNGVNESGQTYASWNWLGGGTSSSNTDGSITSTVSANTTAGFSIVKYTGNGTYPSTVGHGLGSAPSVVITKQLTASTYSWNSYHAGIGNTHYIALNTDSAKDNSVNLWNNTSPTSSVFTINTNAVNTSGVDFIAYCFAEKTGYSKFGSYTGNGNANGTFVYTGFKPAWVVIKKTDSTGYWVIQDNKRTSTSGTNPNDKWIYPNVSDAEFDASSYSMDLLSNGFKLRHTGNYQNSSNINYIYMAFGQSLVGSNNVPCTAR